MIIREWAPSKWIEVLMMVVFLPILAPAIAIWWADEKARKIKRRYLGPRVGEWQRWFAWFPVSLDGGFGPTVWLEPVERTAIGSSYHWGIVYRPINEPDELR